MMRKLDRAIADVRDRRPLAGNLINRVVVVLGDLVALDEGIDDQHVDPLALDFRDDGIDDGTSDDGPVAALGGDDKRHLAAGIAEQITLDVLGLDVVLDHGRDDAAIQFLGGVLAVPNPHPRPLYRRDPKQWPPGCHRQRLDNERGRFPAAAEADSAAQEFSDVVLPVQPCARRDRCRVAPNKRRCGDWRRPLCVVACRVARPPRRKGGPH